MANTITGRIDNIKPMITREYNGKIYYERALVLDATKHDMFTGEVMYPNFPELQFSGEEKCRNLDNFQIGDVVVVSFDLNGSKYIDKETGKERVFTKARAYKIARYNSPVPAAAPKAEPYGAGETDPFTNQPNDEPFF